jgi:cytochrome P450
MEDPLMTLAARLNAPVFGSVDFDPRDPAFLDNPYPLYARLRAEDPVHRAATGEVWFTRHADVSAALTDRRLGRVAPQYAARPKALGNEPVPPSMLFQNPPDPPACVRS